MPRPLEAHAEYRFHPGGPFVARRTVRIRGQEFAPGQDIDPALLPVRKWRQLYESRRIACIPEGDDASRIALARARSADAAQDAPPIADPPPAKPKTQANPAKPAPPPETPPTEECGPTYRMTHIGNGRYVVVDPNGEHMTDPMGRRQAKAIVDDLNA